MLFVSPSSVATYENCPMSYFLTKILKVKVPEISYNLGFGHALAAAQEAFLIGNAAGVRVDPVPVFVANWDAFAKKSNVVFKSGHTGGSVREMGSVLAAKFPDAWDATGFKVLLDRNGKPLLERKLTIALGEDIRMVTKLDLAVVDQAGDTIILDGKATAAPTSREYAQLADQLTAYQAAVTAHATNLGIQAPRKVGYWESVKRAIPKTPRGQGPVVLPPLVVDARSDAQIQAFVRKTRATAMRIIAGEFPRTTRHSFNSPCHDCAMLPLCSDRKTSCYVFDKPEDKAIALRMVS